LLSVSSRAGLSLILISFFTFFLGLGRQAITDSDEAFYAEASREMVETGDWLTPHFNYEDRWQKPALYYWLTAATYLVTGPTEFAARFWSAMSGLGLVLLTWYADRKGPGGYADHEGPRHRAAEPGLSADSAWLAGAITATCSGYFALARLALPDLPLAFCITLAIWTALDRRWVLAGAAAGLGFLMKGPLALVVPGIVLLPIWWREGTLRTLRVRDLAAAATVFAAIGLPWYIAMTVTHGTAYLQSFFIADNFERFATDRFNAPRAIWFYLPIVLGGLIPWVAYSLVLPAASVRDVLARRRRLTDEEWRLLIWALLPLLFFTISIGKQPRYILPVLPPLAILLARSIARRLDTGEGLRPATWLTAGLFAVLAVLLVRAQPLFITAYPALTWLAVAALAGCAVVLAWVAAARAWSKLPGTMTVSALILMLAIQFGALTGRRPEPVEQMAALVKQHRLAGEPVGAYEVFVRNLVFYTRFAQATLFDEGAALDFLKSPERVLLVIRADDLQRLETISGLTTRRLAEVQQYLDPANIRLRTLVAPIPSQDVETVLLVTNR
jgi:4-amino-4-deoxy-L-arabinose transferase-like glycosyltransferase